MLYIFIFCVIDEQVAGLSLSAILFFVFLSLDEIMMKYLITVLSFEGSIGLPFFIMVKFYSPFPWLLNAPLLP